MFLNNVIIFLLVHVVVNPALVLGYQWNEFTITFDGFENNDDITTFERGSFGILNNLTKQCRNLNVDIEMDLHRDEKKSKYYKDLYGDDLYKITVIYPLDSEIDEENSVNSTYNPPVPPTPTECDVKHESVPISKEKIPKRSVEYDKTATELFYDDYEVMDKSETEIDIEKYNKHETTTVLSFEGSTTDEVIEFYIYNYTTEKLDTTTDSNYNTKFETTTEPFTTEMSTDHTNKDNGSDALKSNKDKSSTAVIVLASVATVASVSVISYFVAQHIKTMLQSGTFRFPEPAAAESGLSEF